jgi:hypothetical protein
MLRLRKGKGETNTGTNDVLNYRLPSLGLEELLGPFKGGLL